MNAIDIEAVVKSLSVMLNLRSEFEEEHGVQVARICLLLAERINMPARDMANLSISARLHDIGKMGVLGSTLGKAGKLTKGEWAMVMKHPEFSRDILLPLGLDPSIPRAVHEHHENYDGTGYPMKKKGDEISLHGRMIRIGDMYQSLRTDRVYRKSFSHETAMNIMWKFVNNFDPLLLDAFSNIKPSELGEF